MYGRYYLEINYRQTDLYTKMHVKYILKLIIQLNTKMLIIQPELNTKMHVKYILKLIIQPELNTKMHVKYILFTKQNKTVHPNPQFCINATGKNKHVQINLVIRIYWSENILLRIITMYCSVRYVEIC